MNYALILSGGSGTRLWPLSRRARPKHLIPFGGGPTLLEQTLDRLDGLISPNRRYLITIPEQAPIVRDAARGKAVGIIIEPMGVNNLFPMALSTKMIADRDPDAKIVFLPSDHTIDHPGKLRDALECAFEVAADDYIVTLGIPTDHPEPNYGHVRRTEPIEGYEGKTCPAYAVAKFHEKPNLETAEQYTSDNDWFWNGGIFIFSAAAMLGYIERLQPELHAIVSKFAPVLAQANPKMDSPVIDWSSSAAISEGYKNLSPELRTSIDFAIMEKADKVATIPVEMGWSDLGGFKALAELEEADSDGNRVIVPGLDEHTRVLMPGSKNCSVFPGKRVVVCLDCEDMIVVETSDAVLVLPSRSSRRVKEVVDRLQENRWTDLQ